jgi:alcohol dehydrogenase class IV
MTLSALPNVTFLSPSKFLFGLGTAARIADEVKALGGTKVLLVTDLVLVDKGVVKPVTDSLEAGGIPFVVFDGVLPDAPIGLVVEAYELLKAEDCDLVIGCGGGSPIDIAKMVSLVATNGTDVRGMLGNDRVARPGIPKIIVNTTHVAGADVGFAAVLQIDEVTHEHGVVASRFVLPDVVINDPLLTVGLPRSTTADTAVDTLVTGIECFTGTDANPLSDIICEKILQICADYVPAVVCNGSNLEARYNLSLAASMAGWAYMSSFIGAVHGVSYGVASHCALTHGRSMAAILPAVMRFNIPANPAAFKRIAELFGKDVGGLTSLQAAALSVVAVEELLDAIDVPHTLGAHGLRREDIEKVADLSWSQIEDFLDTNPRTFGRQDVVDILIAAL